MFEFLEKLYEDKALTLPQLEQCITSYNAHVCKHEKIKVVNLSTGDYVSIRKYMALCRKYDTLRFEVLQKDKHYMEMRMRTAILEQRLKAYEYMMTLQKSDLV